MAWFSPLKGKYPGLTVLDKSAPVAFGSTGEIVRGSVMNITEDGEFKLALSTDNDADSGTAYFALTGAEDFQGGMAGSVGQDAGGRYTAADEIAEATNVEGTYMRNTDGSPMFAGIDMGVGVATVTGISVGEPLEFQTDQFDSSQVAGTYKVGTLLTWGTGLVDNDNVPAREGILVPYDPLTGGNIIARVTVPPKVRYINNAPVHTAHGRRTGALVTVLGAETYHGVVGPTGATGPAGG